MIIHRCLQGSEEWLGLRDTCLLTASDCGPWLTKNDKRSRDARMARVLKYLSRDCYKGGDEWLLDIAEKEKTALKFNLPVQRGNALEAEARLNLEEHLGLRFEQVGLITTDDGLFGFSPDGWRDGECGCELKVPLPHTHLGYVIEHRETGEMPEDYQHQVHMALAVSQLPLWHFLSLPTRYVIDGRTLEHPRVHVPVRPNAMTAEIAKGLEEMRKLLATVKAQLRTKTPNPEEAAA